MALIERGARAIRSLHMTAHTVRLQRVMPIGATRTVEPLHVTLGRVA